MKKLLIILTLCILPLLVLQAQNQEQKTSTDECYEEMSDFAYYTCETVTGVIPILVLGFVLFFIMSKVANRNKPYIKRSQEHMDQVEAKYDRIIELLEDVTKRKD
jgi:large-conductance mechanosensitive channel